MKSITDIEVRSLVNQIREDSAYCGISMLCGSNRVFILFVKASGVHSFFLRPEDWMR